MADTPSREELINHVAHSLAGNSFAIITGGHHEEVASKIVDFISARLAAKPSDEGVRQATIEECAKILDECAQDWNRIRDPGMASNARAYARKIRALSPGAPKQ